MMAFLRAPRSLLPPPPSNGFLSRCHVYLPRGILVDVVPSFHHVRRIYRGVVTWPRSISSCLQDSSTLPPSNSSLNAYHRQASFALPTATFQRVPVSIDLDYSRQRELRVQHSDHLEPRKILFQLDTQTSPATINCPHRGH